MADPSTLEMDWNLMLKYPKEAGRWIKPITIHDVESIAELNSFDDEQLRILLTRESIIVKWNFGRQELFNAAALLWTNCHSISTGTAAAI